MSFRLGRSPSQRLTRIALVPAPGGAVRAHVAWLAVVLGLIGASAAGWAHLGSVPAAAPAGPPAQPGIALQQRLLRAELALGLAQARSQELERQIDALNQRLRESQEELAFFRKAGERKHPNPGR